MREDWTAHSNCDLSGRTAVVTGANSGIGLEVARELARRGARIVLACRDVVRAKAAGKSIRSDIADAQLEAIPIDLANLGSVRAFSGQCADRFDRLDILVNSAGVMLAPHGLTADGFEIHLGTNHLGHFALAGLLIEQLLATRASRIVTVTSAAYLYGQLDPAALATGREEATSPFRAYARSKLANLLFAQELNRRLERTGSLSVAAHPGGAATGLGRRATEHPSYRRLLPLLEWISQSAHQAAQSVLLAATSERLNGGELIGPDGLLGLKGRPSILRVRGQAADPGLACRLWQISERLTGVRYGIY